MILYHGSPKTVEVPQFGFGSKENDYGLGFYCTQSNDLAKEWACPTVCTGFSNKYELNMDGLHILHLNGEGYHILMRKKKEQLTIDQIKKCAELHRQYSVSPYHCETEKQYIAREMELSIQQTDRVVHFFKCILEIQDMILSGEILTNSIVNLKNINI